MSKKPKQHDTAVILTIRQADAMTKRGRNDVARWLRRQADSLVREGDNYSARFTARYHYPA